MRRLRRGIWTAAALLLILLGLALVLTINNPSSLKGNGPWKPILAVSMLVAIPAITFFVWRGLRRVEAMFKAQQRDREGVEEHFRTLVESTSDWLWEIDEQARFTYASPRVRELLGYHPEELIGKSAFEMMAPEEADRVRAEYTAYAEQRRPFTSMINVNRHKDGRPVIIESSGVPIFDAHGNWRGYRGIDRDISERINADQARRAAEAQLHLIADALPALIAYLDADQRYRFVNRTYESWHQRSRDTIIGKHFREVLGEDNYALIRPYIERALAGETVHYEIPFPYPDGRRRIVTVDYVPDRENGRVKGLFSLINDVTTHREAEDELYMKDAAIAGSLNAIAIADLEGRLIYVNRSFLHMWGYDREDEVIGHQATGFWVAPEEAAAVVTALFEKGQWFGELEGMRNDGGRFIAELAAAVIMGSDGQPQHLMASFNDVTARRQALEAVRQSEARLREITENINEVFWMSSPDGREIHYVSPAFERLWGSTCEQLYRHPETWLEAIHPDDVERVRHAVAEGAAAGECAEEYRVCREDGGVSWIYDRSFAVRDDHGNVVHIVGVAEDITERRQAEEDVQRLASIVHRSQDFVGIWDIDGRAYFLNEAGRHLAGIRDDEHFYSTHVPDYFFDADRQRLVEEIMPVLMATGRWVGEINFRHFQTDESVPVLLDVFRVDDPKTGIPINFATVARDMRTAKTAEVALRESERRYRQIFENASDGIVYADAETRRFITSNRRFAGMLGYTQEEIARLGVEDIHPLAAMPFVGGRLEELRNNQIEVAQNIPVLRKNGDILYADISTAYIEVEGKRYLAGFFRDVTERKQAEEALRNHHAELELRVRERTTELALAKEAAEEASRAKSEFLSRMSHELRTPMNAILGFAQILEMDDEEPLSDTQRDHVKEILDAGKHLLDLIDEVLDLSRIESGRLSFNLEHIALGGIVHECLVLVKPMAEKQGVVLHGPSNEQCSVYVHADRLRLRQVLLNLLTNAIKYNRPDGEVAVTCPASNGDHVRLSVSDTGPGIAEDNKALLFTPFERLGAEYSGVDGAGIGLALSKRLTEEMHGHIGYDSVEGEGSTFWIELPSVK